MPLHKHTVKLHAPLRSVGIAPAVPPAPPEPVFKQADVQAALQRGRQEGVQQAHAQFMPQLQQAKQQAAQLQSGVLTAVQGKVDGAVKEIYDRVPDLVFTLLERLLPQVSMTHDSVKALVVETLSELSSQTESMEIRLNAADLKLLQEGEHDLDTRYPRLVFKADPALKSGDCVLHSRFGIVDARLETKIQKIQQDIRGKE